MRYSFSAIIEAWLSGVLFLITTSLFFFRILGETNNLVNLLEVDSKWISLLTILFCSLAYTIGWAINHLAELIMDTLFQHPYRAKLEEKEKIPFFTVRSYVFQYGSDQILNDIKYDRQVIRIARANCFNFFLLSIVIGSFYWKDTIAHPVIYFCFAFCVLIFVLSFLQWRSRYKATYKKIFQAYHALPEDMKKKPNPAVNSNGKKKK